MTVRSEDLLLVSRAGVAYQTEAKNLRTPVCDLEDLPGPWVPPVPLDVSLYGTGLIGDELTCEVHSDLSWGPFTYEWSRTKLGINEVLGERGETYTPVDDDLYWQFTVKVTDRFDRESLTNAMTIAESGSSDQLTLTKRHTQDLQCVDKYCCRAYQCSVPKWTGNINFIQDVEYVFHVRSLDGEINSCSSDHNNSVFHSDNKSYHYDCRRDPAYGHLPFTWGDIVWATVRYKENGQECETRPSGRLEYEWHSSHNPDLIPPEPDLSTRRIAPSEG